MNDRRAHRFDRIRTEMRSAEVSALLLSHGADLPWLTGYRAMALERLTVLVLPADGDPVLLVPELEAPKVPEERSIFEVRPWGESEDPVAIAADLVRSCGPEATMRLGISNRAWAETLIDLQQRLPAARWVKASEVTSPVRSVKDAIEIEELSAAARAADTVAESLLAGEIEIVGKREIEVSEEISARLIQAGHSKVNFAIVGSGPNSASPHHDPGSRIIQSGEAVVCDFGGTYYGDGASPGYCSDITRTVFAGGPSKEMERCYEVLEVAQRQAVASAKVGVPAQEIDRTARDVIAESGYGRYFIHRTGHGIGVEEHEDPYIVLGNDRPIVAGNAFSVEPGIYLPGLFGMRIEDIVVATESGPVSLNKADHSLTSV